MTDPNTAAWANWVTLAQEATTAVTNNETFISNTAQATYPLTNAEQTVLVNQVIALTRQMDAVIRILIGDLSATDGT